MRVDLDYFEDTEHLTYFKTPDLDTDRMMLNIFGALLLILETEWPDVRQAGLNSSSRRNDK